MEALLITEFDPFYLVFKQEGFHIETIQVFNNDLWFAPQTIK